MFDDGSNDNTKKLLDEKIDVSAYLIWLMENYPQSQRIVQRKDNFQYRFK